MQDAVSKLTNELVASYARVGGINHLDGRRFFDNSNSHFEPLLDISRKPQRIAGIFDKAN